MMLIKNISEKKKKKIIEEAIKTDRDKNRKICIQIIEPIKKINS